MNVSTKNQDLVLASSAAGFGSWFGGGSNCFKIGTLDHHDGEANISTGWVLVTGLTGEDSRSIGGVSVESLERIVVLSGPGGSRVPLCVDGLLGIVVVKLVIVISSDEFGLERSGTGKGPSSESGCEGRSRGNQGKGDNLGKLICGGFIRRMFKS